MNNKDMISNLLNPDVYKFHNDGVLANANFDTRLGLMSPFS